MNNNYPESECEIRKSMILNWFLSIGGGSRAKPAAEKPTIVKGSQASKIVITQAELNRMKNATNIKQSDVEHKKIIKEQKEQQ